MIFETPPMPVPYLWTTIYILAAIAGIEAGLILGLATRVGGLRALFRLTADEARKRANNASKKKHPPRDHP